MPHPISLEVLVATISDLELHIVEHEQVIGPHSLQMGGGLWEEVPLYYVQ
jgi:hypothetical protein